MNELINRLREQAGGDLYEGFAGSPNLIHFSEKEFEKFARLIIEECNDVAYGLLEENTGAEVVMRIKEHFGVE